MDPVLYVIAAKQFAQPALAVLGAVHVGGQRVGKVGQPVDEGIAEGERQGQKTMMVATATIVTA